MCRTTSIHDRAGMWDSVRSSTLAHLSHHKQTRPQTVRRRNGRHIHKSFPQPPSETVSMLPVNAHLEHNHHGMKGRPKTYNDIKLHQIAAVGIGKNSHLPKKMLITICAPKQLTQFRLKYLVKTNPVVCPFYSYLKFPYGTNQTDIGDGSNHPLVTSKKAATSTFIPPNL